MENKSKLQILERLRSAHLSGNLYNNIEKPAIGNPFKVPVADFSAVFKRELEGISGKCYIADNEHEFQSILQQILQEKNARRVYTTDFISRRLSYLSGVEVLTSKPALDENPIAVSGCECLSARTGSVFVSAHTSQGRQMHSFAETHIILAEDSQLVDDLPDALARVRAKYPNGLPSAVTMITGQSRTADIEKTLILGAHGPKELIVIIVKS